jgi:hypothetical protein
MPPARCAGSGFSRLDSTGSLVGPIRTLVQVANVVASLVEHFVAAPSQATFYHLHFFLLTLVEARAPPVTAPIPAPRAAPSGP